LNSPPWLSGHAPAELEMRRGMWRQQRHGPELARLQRAAVDTERGGALLIEFTNRLYDRQVVEAAEQSERAAKEALAQVQA
jgi:hypothetical protein